VLERMPGALRTLINDASSRVTWCGGQYGHHSSVTDCNIALPTVQPPSKPGSRRLKRLKPRLMWREKCTARFPSADLSCTSSSLTWWAVP
jgi:hypothetical protein